MAQNASSMNDDLSDIIPQSGGAPAASSSPSPWLVMQAQKEVAMGKPGPATAQLGNVALRTGAIHPQVAAYHAQRAGVLPASPQPNPVPQTAANPAGVAGNAQGDPNSVLGQIAQKLKGANIPQTQDQAAALPRGSSDQASDTDTTKNQLSSTQRRIMDPEMIRLNMDTAGGIVHPVSGYEPVLDSKGMPVMGPDGQPLPDKSKPIYDMNNSTIDPNNPFQQQKSNLQKLQDMVQARRQAGLPTRPQDLTGLMMLADTFGNTNKYTQSYAKMRENQEAERQHDLAYGQQNFNDEQGIAKDQNDVLKDQVSAANSAMNGGLTAQLLQNNEAMRLAQGFTNVPKGNPATANSQFMTHSQQEMKDIQGQEQQAAELTRLVNSGNPQALTTIKELVTRMVTGSRPAMGLIQQQVGDPSLGGRIEAELTKLNSGQMTTENVAEMSQLAHDMNVITQARKSGVIQRLQAYGRANGMADQDIQGMMPPEWVNPYPGTQSQAARVGHTSQRVQQNKAQGQYEPDVLRYAQRFNISPDQAKAIKQKRLGGQ